MSDYEYDFEGPQPGLTGFLEPDDVGFGSPVSSSAATAGFGSPASASASSAGFGSPGSASSQKKMCPHGVRKGTCRDCFNQYNADRVSKGLEPEAWGTFCKHGISKFTRIPCTDPECMKKRELPFDPQFKPTGYIRDSDRMFEPPVPNSAGLSFSNLEASEINPVRRDLSKMFESSDDEMRGGKRRSSKKLKRRSSKQLKRRSSKKLKKRSSKKLKRKARKSSRK